VEARGAQVHEVPVASVPDDAWLLDVREDVERAAGYAPGARHIPLSELGVRGGEIPRDEAVHVICRSGVRSAQALAAAGWETVNVAGGMQDRAAGRPMATDSGAVPFVA
jgi:rhodanese-related sulfurtransferase